MFFDDNKVYNIIMPENLDNEIVYSGDKPFKIFKEGRGAHKKFWIVLEHGKSALCKYSKNEYSSIGEIIISRCLDMTNLSHAKYIPIKVRLNNGIGYGTLSPDIITDRKIQKIQPNGEVVCETKYEEHSARSIACDYLNKKRDSQFGKYVKYNHTVDFYTEAISDLYNLSQDEKQGVRTELLKYALFQGMFLLNDMHEENIGFITDRKTGKFSGIMPLYDYGSALQFDWNFRKIFNKTQNNTTLDDSSRMDKAIAAIFTSATNASLFGVKTPLIEASTVIRTDNSYKKIATIDKGLEILYGELAEEIIRNPELLDFYDQLKQVKGNLDHLSSFYGEKVIPSQYVDLAKGTLDKTFCKMDKEIKLYKSNEKSKEHKVEAGSMGM